MIFIFDLDDTLIDTTHLIVPLAAKRSCEALIAGGVKASLEELLKRRQKLAVGLSHSKIFPKLAEEFGFHNNPSESEKKTAIQMAIDHFYNPSVPSPLPLIEGAREVLEALRSRFPLYLVTAGLESAQNSKIDQASLRSFFKDCFIISTVTEKSKTPAFKKILDVEKCRPEEALSIGNRLSSEIADAKRLGMKTCHFQFGEHAEETPQKPEEVPDYVIHSLKEILKICPSH